MSDTINGFRVHAQWRAGGVVPGRWLLVDRGVTQSRFVVAWARDGEDGWDAGTYISDYAAAEDFFLKKVSRLRCPPPELPVLLTSREKRTAASIGQIARARGAYQTDDVQIDNDALLSEAPDAVWVQAWVRLANEAKA